MHVPYAITIILPTGEPKGLRILERPNWTGVGIAFSRTGLDEAKKEREELKKAGVYILLEDIPEGDELPTIYIGEGDPVLSRLQMHNAQKDFWTSAVVFVSNGTTLNKAHTKYLEYKLIQLAQERCLCKLDNQTIPNLPSLTEADKIIMDEFLEKLLSFLPLLNISLFEEQEKPALETEPKFYLKGTGIKAEAVQRSTGFIVLKDSEAKITNSKSCISYYINEKIRLCESKKLIEHEGKLYFTEDVRFSSPSYAASIILGRCCNGRTIWVNAEGKTLKKIQEEEIEN